MNNKAFQDYYPDHVSYCYGCGRLNEYGLQIKSYWDGNESVCIYNPKEYHMAIPGVVYGGLMASIIDCHSIATALAAVYQKEGLAFDNKENPLFGYVTGSLHVDFVSPASIVKPLVLRSQVKEIKEKKVIISTQLYVDKKICANGEVVAIRVPMNIPAAASL